MQPVARHGRALQIHRCRAVADRRDPARCGQGCGADLRSQLRLQFRRATDWSYWNRLAIPAREAATAAGFSTETPGAGGAHDFEPPRRAGVRLSEAAAVSRGVATASSG